MVLSEDNHKRAIILTVPEHKFHKKAARLGGFFVMSCGLIGQDEQIMRCKMHRHFVAALWRWLCGIIERVE